MTVLSVQPISESLGFGAVVSDLRLEHLTSPAIPQQLRSLWLQHGLLVFRNVDPSDRMHVDLSRCFGDLEKHPLTEAYEHESDEITPIRYSPQESTVYEVDGEARGGWLPWHSDLAYVDRINRGGILKPIELPPSGGETGFIDKIEAYERLPDSLKRRIEGLYVAYRLDLDATRQRFGRQPRLKLLHLSPATSRAMEAGKEWPDALHPMVYEQPGTGRKMLNVSPYFAIGIHGLSGPDGDELLAEVIDHAIDDRSAYYHQWKTTNEMVLWDNWRMLHCAKGVQAHIARSMQRTTIAGDYALGRWAEPMRSGIAQPTVMV